MTTEAKDVKTASIGRVSSATHKLEDLIPAFVDVLAPIDPKTHQARMDEYADLALDDDGYFTDADEASDLLNQLFEDLSACAPAYAYFGAHPGDGADFGFWPDLDGLESDAQEVRIQGEPVLKVDSLPAYIAEVNDHGNVTLYEVEYKQVWSIV